MNIRITPSMLEGTVSIPASKSYAHRAIICAALADGCSEISGVTMSKDITATIEAMKALGAAVEQVSEDTLRVSGVSGIPAAADIDCNESGSTLRFIIPIAAALGVESRFFGRGRLPQRPIDIYTRELGNHGITFDYDHTMPFGISGKLTSGKYYIEGDVSSQFITGLLFALPLLEQDSEIIITTEKLESKPYIDITAECMKKFGITVEETAEGYHISGGQKYLPCSLKVEGDYSQAAFFFTANALGCGINVENLVPESVQGDKKILEIISEMCYNGTDELKSFNADCSDIPDLVPILTVLGCFGTERSVIYNAERLRIKESDRLKAISETLNALGGRVTVTDDGLLIDPITELHGGEIDSFGDHRIVMSAAIAALKATGDITIKGAEAVEKSYPDFFRDYNKLGGKANVITLE